MLIVCGFCAFFPWEEVIQHIGTHHCHAARPSIEFCRGWTPVAVRDISTPPCPCVAFIIKLLLSFINLTTMTTTLHRTEQDKSRLTAAYPSPHAIYNLAALTHTKKKQRVGHNFALFKNAPSINIFRWTTREDPREGGSRHKVTECTHTHTYYAFIDRNRGSSSSTLNTGRLIFGFALAVSAHFDAAAPRTDDILARKTFRTIIHTEKVYFLTCRQGRTG